MRILFLKSFAHKKFLRRKGLHLKGFALHMLYV